MRTGMDEAGMGFGLEWTRGVFSDEKRKGKMECYMRKI